MRRLLAVLLTLAPATAAAQSVQITDVRIGLPPGRFVTEREENNQPSPVVKNATWAPVYVQLRMLKAVDKPAALVIESSDADDLGNVTHVPLQNLSDLPPGTTIEPTEMRYVGYVRPGGRQGVTVSVRLLGEGKPTDWRAISEPKPIKYLRTRDVNKFVVLSLGSKLPGFDLPNENVPTDENAFQQPGLRGGRIETAAITNLNELPDRWIGYDAADMVVLSTGAASDKDFLTPLFTEPRYRPRLDALVEWVRRGGDLVVSVGANAQLVAQYELLQELLPVAVVRADPAAQVKELPLDWATQKGVVSRPGFLSARQGATFPVVNAVPKPDRGFRQLVPALADAGGRQRVVTQSALGLGRVTLVGFDLDRSPFTDYKDRGKVWDLILQECGSTRASVGSGKQQNTYGGSAEDDFANGLRSHIDAFEGVPVISFGWVALFILLYTLLIGPVEYLILKKVFKRLELTWVTFPVIVLTVSAIAYFTAYALKGSDLMVNKVDAIDIDPASDRVYGRTWMTIFSPRIDTNTVGVEPNDGWAAANPEQPPGGSTIDWLGAANRDRYGRGGSFFRRSYYYRQPLPDDRSQPFAAGLAEVPIQVWSTKAFAADWSAIADKKAVESQLVHPPSDPTKVSGSFTLNLPVPELKDVYLVYAGRGYKLDNPITPGVPVTVALDRDDPDWLAKVGSLSAITSLGQQDNTYRRGGVSVSAGSANLFGVMFHDRQSGDDKPPVNSTLRRLDQSWRVSEANRDEVIVVAKLATVRGPADEVIGGQGSPSPTKLWLKGLPAAGAKWPGLVGTLSQETFLRVYVPVKPAAKR